MLFRIASASAQACCIGGTVLTPGRLGLHEDALVALAARGAGVYGSYDGRGAFLPLPKGDAEADFEQDLIATLRVLSRGQVTFLVPLVETYRRDPGPNGQPISDNGGGIGDVQLFGRWDAYLAGASRVIPGFAVLASLVLPTGVAPEQATHILSTDATGTGAVQASVGFSLEQSYGDLLFNVTPSVKLTSARTLGGVHTQLGPTFGVVGAIGYAFSGPAVALTVAYTGSLPSDTDGVSTPGTARTQLVLGAAVGYVVSDDWRVQGALSVDPPTAHAGENEPANAGATFTLFRTW